VNAVLARLAGQIRAASASGVPLRLRGGGSKDFLGRTPVGEVLALGEYRGIVAYEPTELVVTARCGTSLDELHAVLADRGQWLAFEPPSFGPGATVGGMVAAGLSGPSRAQAGAVRDFVLGVRVMDAQGERLDFGGQVMKNVAGFDVSRLHAGALGVLGPLLEVSLKVLPRPAASATLEFEQAQTEALHTLNNWLARPLPITASAWQAGRLRVRLAGAARAVESAVAVLGGERLADAGASLFWQSLREQTHAFFVGAAPLWRLSVPATAAVLDLPGEQLVEWGGAQRWWREPLDPGLGQAASAEVEHRVRSLARAAGGHATRFRGGDRSGTVFEPLSPPIARLHRRLKDTIDPAGIFNRGRLYAER
jgi:glycolate oxidase FAD binding subunit